MPPILIANISGFVLQYMSFYFPIDALWACEKASFASSLMPFGNAING